MMTAARILFAAIGSLVVAATVQAQVKVQVLLDQEQFLPGERLPVKVRIINRSGQTLALGAKADWLQLSVESVGSFVIPRLGDVPVVQPFELGPSKMATKTLDLQPYFDLTRPGRYSVVATVNIAQWQQLITSDPKPFNIVSGVKLRELEFGVPPVDGDGPPEVRKYILQQANYLRSQIRLYVRVADATGELNYRVVPVGMLVSFSQPEAQVDARSQLHLLYQTGPKLFSYNVIDPNGEVVVRHVYRYVRGRPRLEAIDEGTIRVKNGVRVPNPTDIPPPSKTGQRAPRSDK